MDGPQPPGGGTAPVAQFNNCVLTGGTYVISAARNNEHDVGSDTKRPQSLEDIVAFDALLNAGERYPAPKCHPDTRKAALEIVTNWTWNRGAVFKGIMWVSGAPGVGKSALLQTTCEILAGPNNPIHASFFFARGKGIRELASSLAPTIAHQFAISSTVCRWHIWYLLQNDPTVLLETLHSQFRKLVIAPALSRSYIQFPMVVVIDGLDECVNVQDRVALLELIFEAAKTLSIRFLIASRPEEEIENFLKQTGVAQHVDHIILDEATFKTSKDIRIFLRSEFARIRQARPDSIPSPINGQDWPGDAIIDRATVDSDGQFIFSKLFIGYIDEELYSPQEQLDSLLNPPNDIAAFSKLDRLYHQILTRRPRHICEGDAKFIQYQEMVKGILHVVVAWPHQSSIAQVADVLGVEVHVVQSAVRGPLRTLFKFEGSGLDSKISFCHKSFGDCLSDPNRSAEFHVPPDALDLLYHRILSRPVPSDPARSFSQQDLLAILYAIVGWSSLSSAKTSLLQILFGSGNATRVFDLDKAACFTDGRATTVRNISRHYRPLLPITLNHVVGLLDMRFKDFLLDQHRSKEFHVPPDALGVIYLLILSRPPPSDTFKTFSRGDLIAVLHTAVESMCISKEGPHQLAIGSDTIRKVTSGPQGHLFHTSGSTLSLFDHSLAVFLLNPHRSELFCHPQWERLQLRPVFPNRTPVPTASIVVSRSSFTEFASISKKPTKK